MARTRSSQSWAKAEWARSIGRAIEARPRCRVEAAAGALAEDRRPTSSASLSPTITSTRIAYHSGGRPGGPGIFVRRADGSGGIERLTTGTHLPVYWSADGTWLAYADFGTRGISIATVEGLMRVDVEGDRTPRVLLEGGYGRISPTERWLASTSSITGSDEIYVLPHLTCAHAHLPRRRTEPDLGP